MPSSDVMLEHMACWGVTDGSAGMVTQVRGVAEALGCGTVQIKTCRKRWPWSWWPTGATSGVLAGLTADSDLLHAPWPDVLISCGRRSVGLALAIRKASQGKTWCVHIQDPKINPARLDQVIAPEHDDLRGDNVIKTRGALHYLTHDALAQAGRQYEQQFAAIARPWVALMIGGSTRRYTLDESVMQHIIMQLEQVIATGHSVLITPSRRTGEAQIEQLRTHFAGNDRAFVADLAKDNPYLGFLGVADVLMVTEDSVSMLSEAAFTAKPLYILTLPGHKATKAKAFTQWLKAQGIARVFEGHIDTWQYAAFNDMDKIVTAIRQQLIRRSAHGA